uniref:Uncharacterized protein n=1 Tax=Strongyloides papillosus TaxID=174720 RepID=A0A0N5C8J4_STREA
MKIQYDINLRNLKKIHSGMKQYSVLENVIMNYCVPQNSFLNEKRILAYKKQILIVLVNDLLLKQELTKIIATTKAYLENKTIKHIVRSYKDFINKLIRIWSEL